MNIIQFPRPTGITQSAINLLHEVAASWSKSEPAPLTVAFGLTDEQEAWCVFSDGMTDEPRYSFWEQNGWAYCMNHRACQFDCGGYHPTTARTLKELIVKKTTKLKERQTA